MRAWKCLHVGVKGRRERVGKREKIERRICDAYIS